MKLCNHIWKLFQGLLALLLCLMLLANFWVMGTKLLSDEMAPTFLGFHWAVVLSGSMEPAISVDDLIVSLSLPSYEEGDVITYRGEHSLTTHRIIAISEDGFITQGDANNTPDVCPVSQDRVVGKVLFALPGVGRILSTLRTPLGLTILVLLVFVMLELPHLFHKKNPEE